MPVVLNVNPVAFSQASNSGVFGATADFLKNRLEQLVSTGLVSDQFIKSAWDTYDKFHGSDMVRQIKSISNQVSSIFKPDIVTYLSSLSQIQQAKPIMQRFIMAQPDLRRLYLNYEVDGYSESYVNVHGNLIGEQHPDYRLVMDGILQEVDDELFTEHYFEEQAEDDPVRLTAFDQFDVIRSWDKLKILLAQSDEDPTSIYCDKR